MKITGEHPVEEEPDQLWETILDPKTLESTIPGAKDLERSGHTYEGTLTRGLAGISVTLSATVEITDQKQPQWIEVDITGSDNTINSHVDGQARVEFEENGGETTLVYDTEFTFAGKLASLGSRIIERKVKKDLQTFFQNLEEYVDAQPTPD